MEELLESQQELHGRIARTWENLKKSGQQNINVDVVRTALSLLDSRWARIEEQHHTLMRDHRAALKEHAYIKDDFLAVAETQYMAQRAILSRRERQLAASSSSEVAANKGAPTPAPTLPAPASAPSYPRIELPHFNGQFEEWPAFRDLFESMVINETALPNVRKLHYLKTSISGEAEGLIKNLPTTDENFQRAWSTLKEHYENTRLLVRSYLNAFTSLPKMRPKSMGDLRRIFHGVTSTAGAMEGIGRPITAGEDLFVHLVVNLLDQDTRREWDKSLRKSTQPPTYEELQAFLKEQTTSEDALAAASRETSTTSRPRSGRVVRTAHQKTGNVNPSRACPACGGPHFLAKCEQYLKKTPQARREVVNQNNRCLNCLGRHPVNLCTVTTNCLKCSGRHHTTLHDAIMAPPSPATQPASVHAADQPVEEHAAALLATVRVTVTDAGGRKQSVRALLDPGSEVSLITESLAQRLRLPRTPSSVAIFGVGGQSSGVARGRVTLNISALDGTYTTSVSTLVLPRLSTYSGKPSGSGRAWQHVLGLRLADPDFTARDPVEMLLGAGVYSAIIMGGIRKGGPQDPIAQETRLGWILLGGLNNSQLAPVATTLHCAHEEDISSRLRNFWEWEEPLLVSPPATEEEMQAEAHFATTHERLPSGRFRVRLPFRTPPASHLALTRKAAERMLDVMGRRFARDRSFLRSYTTFMQEYIDLQHMSPVPHNSTPIDGRLCYLPHHGVFKGTGLAAKLRVVFNGSSLTAAGMSLNDHLLTGPNLVPALPDVLLRWRRHRFAFTCDVEKMYRQIEVHPDDRDLQRILWNQDEGTREFQLNTVTYGTSCAPFLAIRVLQHLAREGARDFPSGAAALLHDTYVDDILSGSSTLESGVLLQKELSTLCMAGGFPLRKWSASHPELLSGIPELHRQDASAITQLPMAEHSVLGLRWRPTEDCLSVSVGEVRRSTPTKRAVLSQVARLFDPLGWLAPVIVQAKLLLQAAWLQRLDWDTPLAAQDANVWYAIVDELPTIESLRVPRWLEGVVEESELQIHGFADASERAYGAVVYLRAVTRGKIYVSLVQAKSKVAPVKRVSLPRLELCAAALLSKLSGRIRDVLQLTSAPTFHWCDSTVALAWIRGHPARWTTFVANRVAEIQRESHHAQWRHVPGIMNPADCVSRGLSPRELAHHSLWWYGPQFLREEVDSWPGMHEPHQEKDLPEQRPLKCLATTKEVGEPPELKRFSKLSKLLRVTAWILRWKPPSRNQDKEVTATPRCILRPSELEGALMRWILVTQGIAFRREIEDIRAGRAVHGRSALRKLTPFLDQRGILRVGGRLKHALLDPDQRHPMILSATSRLSHLLIEEHHLRTLHGGAQATLAPLRQRFWLLRGRQLVRAWIHRCPKCVRWRATSPQPIMGDLPAPRVSRSRPFLHTGVDFAGPFKLRTTKGRGHKSYKGFLSVFVCFSTRAVHLEPVSDYSTAAFLAAFRRFVSRRGLCQAVYSDCGTNFVGADSELRALFAAASPDAHHIAGHLAGQGIEWHFNPPAAPHFGGLWEAAVKSAKHHIRRVVGDAALTFEEMATLLAEVEACLNSRPLQALSDDPEDLAALTPGHFLVGEPLLAIPEPSLLDTPVNRLSRWRLLQSMRDHLWNRWAQEYMQSLTPRAKWWKESGGISEGQLCLIKNETTSPTRWPLGRVVRLYQGKDSQARVADVKTESGVLTRPVVKLVPLPGTSSE